MSKKYNITRPRLNKIEFKLHKAFNLIFVSLCFANDYIKDIAEEECIITPLEYIKCELDEIICMIDYIKTKDENFNLFN